MRGFQWKGSIAFLRDFNRDASNQEMGMQSVELAGENRDGDFDGVINELRVGDQTALAIYISAQPRPTTRQELARLGLIPALHPGGERRHRPGHRPVRRHRLRHLPHPQPDHQPGDVQRAQHRSQLPRCALPGRAGSRQPRA